MKKRYYQIIGIIFLIVGIIALSSQSSCSIAGIHIAGKGSPISCLFYSGYDEDSMYKVYSISGIILFLFGVIAGIVLLYLGFKNKK